MGLGKTVQAIALDLGRREKFDTLQKQPKTLIITYLGIVSSWVEHYKNWSDLKVIAIDNKDRSKFLKSLEAGDNDVYIVHWQGIRLMPELADHKWFHIIGDEIHAIQNRKTQQTKALKLIPTIFKTGLSGTPAYDKPDDLWSILHWLYPKYWTSYWKYYEKHVLYVDNNGYRVTVGVNNEKELQAEMATFYMRRRKQEVMPDLPEKYYSERIVDLHPKQRRAYEQMRKDMLTWVGEHEDEAVAAPVVIAQLTRLQQFSDAYGQISTDTKIIGGEPKVFMRLAEPSTKIDAVLEIVNSTAEPIVVFSQFSQVIELLRARLDKLGISNGIFIGSTSAGDRGKIIENFQAGKLRVFAGTIAAGGVGITLTRSSTVVFIDRSWSPSQNIQAEDRLHRIGQQNAVHVIDIISRDTIDAKRIEQINMSWAWIRKLLGETEDEHEDAYEW